MTQPVYLVAAALVLLTALATHAAPAKHHHQQQPPRAQTGPVGMLTVDVVIVGAGMAGVAAAGVLAELEAGNVSFVVLEATNRTGGRMVSRTFGSPSIKQIQIEVGANWVHGTDPDRVVNPIAQMAAGIGLKVARVPGSTSNLSNYAVYNEDGTPAPARTVAGACDDFARAYTCANASSAAMAAGVDYDMHTALQACGWTRSSVMAALLEWEGTASDASIPSTSMSLRFNLPDGTYSWLGPDDSLVIDQRPRGYASIVDVAGGARFPPGDGRVLLNSAVATIDTSCDGVTVTTTGGQVVNARHAVVTIPFGALGLQHAQLFTGTPLPEAQASAMAIRTRGNFTKIFMQFETPFWDLTVLDFLASAHIPGLGRMFAEFHNFEHPERQPGSRVLFMAVVDPLSIIIEQAADDVALGIVMGWLLKLFPNATIARPVDFYVTRHGVDPLAMSSYSTVPFGYTEEMFQTSRQPLQASNCPASGAALPTVFFAGEACCRAFNGYVHSAFVSGQDAGMRVLEQLGFGPAPLSMCDRPLT